MIRAAKPPQRHGRIRAQSYLLLEVFKRIERIPVRFSLLPARVFLLSDDNYGHSCFRVNILGLNELEALSPDQKESLEELGILDSSSGQLNTQSSRREWKAAQKGSTGEKTWEEDLHNKSNRRLLDRKRKDVLKQVPVPEVLNMFQRAA